MLDARMDLDGFGPDVGVVDFEIFGISLPQTNPYNFSLDHDPVLHALPPQECAPLFPEVQLEPSAVTFLERLPNGLSDGAPSGVFRVQILNEGERLLKIFHGVTKELPGRSFTREARAYQNLLHGGACGAGVVPHCYGWAHIDQKLWTFPNKRDWLCRFRDDPKPIRALILEIFSNATRLTLRHIMLERADAAMEALKVIHQSRVCHNDIHPRNILLLPNGRIVWVDFEHAASWPWYRRGANTQAFESELALSWDWLYHDKIPWKWYASRKWNEQHRQEDIDIKSLEQGLVNRGYKILIPYPKELPEDWGNNLK